MTSGLDCYASAAFGLEGIVAGELKKLGMSDVRAENGGVRFSATPSGLFLCNLRLHCCDRIFVVLATDTCKSFDSLFRLASSIDWSLFFSGPESIDVTCKCSRSTLMSPRDCQSVTKKSVIEKLRKQTGRSVFPETGPSLPIHIVIRNDVVMILLNTSGSALSRRGYRTWNGEAPLKETLAASLVELSPWHPGLPLHDPCCGTGTILVEAAFRAGNIAPGLRRSFAMESLKFFSSLDFSVLRSELNSRVRYSGITGISGSDVSRASLALAERHLRQAGLDPASVPLACTPLQELQLKAENGVFICNPPYGERLGDQKECRALYRDLRMLKERHPGWRLCAISSDPAFERSYGKRADKKRRLYNGRLECVYYIYF